MAKKVKYVEGKMGNVEIGWSDGTTEVREYNKSDSEPLYIYLDKVNKDEGLCVKSLYVRHPTERCFNASNILNFVDVKWDGVSMKW